jgi:hypothetical protein
MRKPLARRGRQVQRHRNRRHLLERHIDHAKRKGAHILSVYTTDPGCNWGFYEAYGFKRAVEFEDDIGSYLEGSRSKGLIFTLDLND